MVESYEIERYDISEWSCGMKEDYVYWLDIEEGQGFGLGYEGNGYSGNHYTKNLHSNDILFTFN